MKTSLSELVRYNWKKSLRKRKNLIMNLLADMRRIKGYDFSDMDLIAKTDN